MISQEKIISLLGQGLSAEVVATAVGCEPSYISQLLSKEEVHRQVSELRVQNLQAATKRDNKWDQVEDKLLDALVNKVESSADFMKPQDLVRFLSIVNAAKRRGAQAQDAMVVNNTIVNLTIPQRAVQQFVVNATNQVVQVDEQTLLTIPSQNLRTLAISIPTLTTKFPYSKAPTDEQLKGLLEFADPPRKCREYNRADSTETSQKESGGTLATIAKERLAKLLSGRVGTR